MWVDRWLKHTAANVLEGDRVTMRYNMYPDRPEIVGEAYLEDRQLKVGGHSLLGDMFEVVKIEKFVDYTFGTIAYAKQILEEQVEDGKELFPEIQGSLIGLFNAALAWKDEYLEEPGRYSDGRMIPAGRLYKQDPEGRAILKLATTIVVQHERTMDG